MFGIFKRNKQSVQKIAAIKHDAELKARLATKIMNYDSDVSETSEFEEIDFSIITPAKNVDIDIEIVQPMIADLMAHLSEYDISTFKQQMRAIMEVADTRPQEDRTDFGFMQRRKTDRG